MNYMEIPSIAAMAATNVPLHHTTGEVFAEVAAAAAPELADDACKDHQYHRMLWFSSRLTA